MVADLPKNEQTQEVDPASGAEGISLLDRYQKGEIDLDTLVYLMPAGSIPPHLLALLEAVKSNQAPEDEAPAVVERKKAAERAERMDQMIEQWRLDRGPGYVEAYKQFQKTGEAVEAGSRVFESDWFRQLQDTRAAQIAALEQKKKSGGLDPKEEDELKGLRRAHVGDENVSKNWKALSDDYQKLKDRENTGGMSEKELRVKEAELKARIYDELDKASPELRERLLREIEARDPKFRDGYEARLRAQNQKPEYASNLDTLRNAHNLEDSFLPETQGLISGISEEEDTPRSASAAKEHGFSGVKTDVDVRGSFTTATVNTSAMEQREAGLTATVTAKPGPVI